MFLHDAHGTRICVQYIKLYHEKVNSHASCTISNEQREYPYTYLEIISQQIDERYYVHYQPKNTRKNIVCTAIRTIYSNVFLSQTRLPQDKNNVNNFPIVHILFLSLPLFLLPPNPS